MRYVPVRPPAAVPFASIDLYNSDKLNALGGDFAVAAKIFEQPSKQ